MKITAIKPINGNALYAQWLNHILKPLNREVFAMAEYINYFKTPWIKKSINDYKHQYSSLTDSSSGQIIEDFDFDLVSYYSTEDEGDPDEIYNIELYKLFNREYVINNDPDHLIIYGRSSVERKSSIGYYISLLQTTPVDSIEQHFQQGTKDKYLCVPFSNGDYYILGSNENGFYWKVREEATQQLGYKNLFNIHRWPCRYIYEQEYNNRSAIKLYNWTHANGYIFNIKDKNDLLWVSKNEGVFEELLYNDEELFADTVWTIEETKLQKTNRLGYNIISKDELPSSIKVEVY